MSDNFYRSGQAAKQLGVSSYHVRRLCEVGEITAELTAGQQWKIPASEIARLQRQGVPDVPVESDEGDDHAVGAFPGPEGDEPPEGLLAAPSTELIEAADEVKIVESRLKKRRVEKESEELEDWFRERQRQQAEREAAERQKTEAVRAAQRRRSWFDSWIQYALRSRPYDAPRETELEIHEAVQAALANLDPDQPRATTQRLVDAAVERVLRPWRRKNEIRGAIESAMNRLPWDINHGPEWASVKKEALEAAMASIGKMRADATSREIQEMAWLAVQPMARGYSHWKTCRDMAASIFLPGGSYEETQEAREAVSEALARLPVGTSQKELEKTKEETLQPYHAVIQRRAMARSISLPEGTVEDDRQAREAVGQALARLPLSASQKEVEDTKRATLEVFRAAVLKRKAEAREREEQARRESEQARQRVNVEARVDRRLLTHLEDYLRELEDEDELECESDVDRWELEKDLKKRIRPMLMAELRQEPDISDQEIDELIEDLVDEHIEEFLED